MVLWQDSGGKIHLVGQELPVTTSSIPATAPPRHLGALFAAAIVLLLALFASVMRGHLALTPDSWTYYELARSIPADFYRLHLTRQFQFDTPYSSSFPPLWPALIFLADRIGGTGPATGFWLAAIAAGLFAALSEAAGRRCFAMRWIGLGSAALVLSHGGLLEEITGGRTMPLQLCFYAALLWALATDLKPARAALAGLLSGLAVMNRFDALPLMVVIGLAVPVLAQRDKVRSLGTWLITCLAVTAPWIAYSQARFGRWFVSDNGGIALRADRQAYITDWWPTPPPSVIDAPAAWLAKVATNAALLLPEMVISPGLATLAAWLVAALFMRARHKARAKDRAAGPLPGRQAIVAMALALAATLSGNVLTGYFDARYFVPHLWLGLFAALGSAAWRLEPADQREGFGAMAAVAMLATSAVLLGTRMILASGDPTPAADPPARIAALRQCLSASPRPPVLLIADPLVASRWSALYGWDVVMLPRNLDRLSPQATMLFASRYGITHIVGLPDAPGLAFAPLAGCPEGVLGLTLPGRSPAG